MTVQKTGRAYKIGEIYLMNFGDSGSGSSEQKGLRPGVVFQNNIGNSYSPNIIALPLTSSVKKTGQLTHVKLSALKTGLRTDSVVLCENPERMSKEKIGRFICKLSDEYMKKITKASLLATSAISFLDIKSLIEIWEKAVAINAA